MSFEVQGSQIRSALAAGIEDGNVVVLILPAETARELFGGTRNQPDDYTLAEYRRDFAPDLSLSRIREQCASGHFPDVTLPDGTIVRGAYKDSTGQWRVTPEGIEERRRRNRTRARGSRHAPRPDDSDVTMAVEDLSVTKRFPSDSDTASPAEAPAATSPPPEAPPKRGSGRDGRVPGEKAKSRPPQRRQKADRAWRNIRGVG